MALRTETGTGVPQLGTLPKAPTGVRGLDELTGGGIPRGRTTLVTGAAGTGKTLFGVEFLVRGALEFDEPGVMLAFEESADELATNVLSMGMDLHELETEGRLLIDHVVADPGTFVETGAYDLEGLFIRLAAAVDRIGAKRVVLDTIEVLFGTLSNESVIRTELGRLFRWIKDHGLTAVVTAERGNGMLTRHGIEEYVSDCVVVLDQRLYEQYSTRRLHILKYRGTSHGTNEYPFLITERGLEVIPITSSTLDYGASLERVTTGVERLDHMLGGGLLKGGATLVSGEAGTGKTTVASKFVEAACARGERALYMSFEESPAQLIRDMGEVGIDLGRWVDSGRLRMWSGRPSMYGLEGHIIRLSVLVDEFRPSVVAIDSVTSLHHVGDAAQVTAALTREIDILKSRGISSVLTAFNSGTGGIEFSESSDVALTSAMDTWLLLRNVEYNGERNRLLFVRKSRGSAHSNQVREFVISSDGIDLTDVYTGPGGVLAGSARIAQEARERREVEERIASLERMRRQLLKHRTETQARIESLELERSSDDDELAVIEAERRASKADSREEAAAMATHRWADPGAAKIPSDGESG